MELLDRAAFLFNFSRDILLFSTAAAPGCTPTDRPGDPDPPASSRHLSSPVCKQQSSKDDAARLGTRSAPTRKAWGARCCATGCPLSGTRVLLAEHAVDVRALPDACALPGVRTLPGVCALPDARADSFCGCRVGCRGRVRSAPATVALGFSAFPPSPFCRLWVRAFWSSAVWRAHVKTRRLLDALTLEPSRKLPPHPC